MHYWHDVLVYNEKLDEKREGHFRFFSEAVKFRKTHDIFRRENFLEKVNNFDFPIVFLKKFNLLWLLATNSLYSLKCMLCNNGISNILSILGHKNTFMYKFQLSPRPTLAAFFFFLNKSYFREYQSFSLTCKFFINVQKDVTWHEDNWSNSESRFLAFT